MARTHGTRSAYNAGCRCDNCREASRAARARQRAVSEGRTGQPWSAQGEPSSRPEMAGVGLATLAVLGLGAGAFSLWHGATQSHDEASDPEAARRSRQLWVIAGIVLVILGGLAIRASVIAESS